MQRLIYIYELVRGCSEVAAAIPYSSVSVCQYNFGLSVCPTSLSQKQEEFQSAEIVPFSLGKIPSLCAKDIPMDIIFLKFMPLPSDNI